MQPEQHKIIQEQYCPEEKKDKNIEREFLSMILGLANDSTNQIRFLEQLGTLDFRDPIYEEVFKTECSILLCGEKLNLETFARHFRGKVDCDTLQRICLEMFRYEYIDCTPEIVTKLETYIESLKMRAMERKQKTAC